MNDTYSLEDLVDDYKAEFMLLEESYAELAGHYPSQDDVNFWSCHRVRQVDALLHLWWDVRDIRDGLIDMTEYKGYENEEN